MISEMVRAGELAEDIGIVAPKVLRLEADDQQSPYRLDSTGVYMTRNLRHLDRGSEEIDRGQYEKMEYVFGYTGAAALFRRRMIEDVSIDGQFLDEDFVFYREDGDLSWRAQLMGWKCLYTPRAVCFHVRRVFPTNRSAVSALINMHSTKNRFLMRVKNITPAVYRRVFWPTTLRDIGIAGYVLLRERSSLPGLIFILKNWKRTWAKRKLVQAKMRVKDSDVAAWFDDEPVSRPFVIQL
jgi:GT2 family glycosyltransferase